MKKLFLLFLITNMTAATLTGQVMMMFSTDPASGITSPLDVDSLFYWYAADVGVTTNNNKVTQWNDLSGNGHHVTQADTSKAPTFEATGGPNSRPTMTFDGTDDFLASAAHFWGSDDLTVIVVMKFANATRDVNESIVGRHSTTPLAQWRIFGRNAAGSYAFRYVVSRDGTNPNEFYSDFSTKPTSFRAISFVSFGNITPDAFVDGAAQTETNATAGTGNGTVFDSADNGVSVGATNALTTPVGFLQGSISEIIVFSRALTTGERSGLEQNYLCKKYGLACP